MPSQDNLLHTLQELGKVDPEVVRKYSLGTTAAGTIKKLFSERYVTGPDLLEAAIKATNGKPEQLRMVVATDIAPEGEAIQLIPGDFARKNVVLPYRLDGEELVIVLPFESSGNVELRDGIRKVARVRSLHILHSSIPELKQAIDNAYRAEGQLKEIASGLAAEEAADIAAQPELIEVIREDGPAVKFVNLIMEQAISDGASDIHIEQDEHAVLVRFRRDGVLHDFSTDNPKSMANGILTRIKILGDMDIAEKRRPQDGRLTYDHPVRGKVDFRCAILPTVNGEKAIMRILDNSQASLNLPDLGFHPDNLERFKSSYTKPYGMVLVTGPTGSGKSTTLYAALNAITSPEVNIITVEDPVEYKVPRINQVQVNPKAGLTFASALRSILRADPDVVLIGEVRDSETAQIAVEAAQTGHLVLTTLHTNDAPSAVSRLVDLGVEPFLVGTVVESVLAQRLIRRLCKECRVPYTPDAETLLSLKFPWNPEEPLPTLYEPGGVACKACGGVGYKGRLAIHEVLLMSPAIEKIIVREGTSIDIADQAYAEGMHSLRTDGWYKVLEGTTSIKEILRVVV